MSAKLERRLAKWFADRFPQGFSDIQKRALPHTLAGHNTLILAPTGSGKTLAAFLSVLSSLARDPALPNAVLAVYVSPLRALTRDIRRNLEAPLTAINADGRIRVETRTGDTSPQDRARIARQRPHILLTTPESLSALLSQTAWSNAFDSTRTVIVDEIHSFGENKRGTLLALTLERLEHRAGRTLQRIGLSATASPVDAVCELLCGSRPCSVAQVDAKRVYALEIAEIPPDDRLPAAGFSPYRTAHITAGLVTRAQSSIVFTTTRSGAEQTGLALHILLPELEDRIEVHHASVDRQARLAIEDGLSEGKYKAVVASSSLELGVDFSAVDQVVLVGTPRGVSRSVQRLGRAGHRVGGIAQGFLVPVSLPDLVQCVALREAVRQGRLDPLRPPRAPLDVLAQILLGMAVEREWSIEEAFTLVRKAGPYQDLPRADFDQVLDYLAGGGRVLAARNQDGETGFGKVVIEGDRFRVANRKTARQYFLNIGTISDSYQMRVVLGMNRTLGSVEESFIHELQSKDAFVIAGRTVRVKRTHQNVAYVERASGQHVKTPRWDGGKMSLTARLAAEEITLRRLLRDEPGKLRSCYRLSENTAQRILDYCACQRRAAAIPTDSPVIVERIRRGRSMQFLFHAVAGRGVNRSIAWVLGHRLGDPEKSSIVANFDDHAFVLTFSATGAPDIDQVRAACAPACFKSDLRAALEKTGSLGRRFRPTAENAQLLARRTPKGPSGHRMTSWNSSLLYQTLLVHEPNHPLIREAVRETLEDELEADRAASEAARIQNEPWEVYDLPRPSPFAMPLFAMLNQEVLLAQNPDQAFHELAERTYVEWEA